MVENLSDEIFYKYCTKNVPEGSKDIFDSGIIFIHQTFLYLIYKRNDKNEK
jgi:hypothetical protein